MNKRDEILDIISEKIIKLKSSEKIFKVGIDGVDGSGKTYFANELTKLLENKGQNIIRSSVDYFHNTKEVRYHLGSKSPLGFFKDSYNYKALKNVLLDPLLKGQGYYQTSFFEHKTDSYIVSKEEKVESGYILIFDGIFLHRKELRDYWDFSIFLKVKFDISVSRCYQRDKSGSSNPNHELNRRYVEGQKIYFKECEPTKYSTININNEDLNNPFIIE